MIKERAYAELIAQEINKYLPEDKQVYCYNVQKEVDDVFMVFALETEHDILSQELIVSKIDETTIPNHGILTANRFRNKLGLLTIERI